MRSKMILYRIFRRNDDLEFWYVMKDDATKNKYRIINFSGNYIRPGEFCTIEEIESYFDTLIQDGVIAKWQRA